MNQILQVQENRNKNRSNPIDTKKIVLFFAACIIIFGIIMLVQGVYSGYQNHANRPVNPPGDDGDEVEEHIPTIAMIQTEDNKLKINIDSQIAISHIIYSWNNDVPVTLDELGKTSIEELIDIPVGDNIIQLSVIDSNGKETKQEGQFIIEQAKKPIIDLSVVGNNIKIIVTSEVELSHVTYKWNSEEEQKHDMITFENRKKFEKELEIPKGQNTLKITAIDTNGNTTEKSQEIKGVAKLKDPRVVVSGEYITFTFTAEENMKKVEFVFNGETFVMDTNTFGTTKTVKYRKKLVNGWNYLKLIGTTVSDAQNTTVWKYEYKPQ